MPETKDRAFFHIDGDIIVGNDAARGPWSPDACHAGPVTGVLARSVEQLVADKQLARLSVTFHRPIPMDGFRAQARVERNGRGTAVATAILTGSDGRVCATASSLHLATHRFVDLPTASVPNLNFDDANPGSFPVDQAAHSLPFFRSGIDVAYPPGETGSPGPTTLWMRTLPILQGEAPTPFQSLCPLADCGNGISRNAEITEASCINPDLTIVVFRLPRSDWLAAKAMSFWEPTGIGMSHSMLYDTQGLLGTALQTLVVKPIP